MRQSTYNLFWKKHTKNETFVFSLSLSPWCKHGTKWARQWCETTEICTFRENISFYTKKVLSHHVASIHSLSKWLWTNKQTTTNESLFSFVRERQAKLRMKKTNSFSSFRYWSLCPFFLFLCAACPVSCALISWISFLSDIRRLLRTRNEFRLSIRQFHSKIDATHIKHLKWKRNEIGGIRTKFSVKLIIIHFGCCCCCCCLCTTNCVHMEQKKVQTFSARNFFAAQSQSSSSTSTALRSKTNTTTRCWFGGKNHAFGNGNGNSYEFFYSFVCVAYAGSPRSDYYYLLGSIELEKSSHYFFAHTSNVFNRQRDESILGSSFRIERKWDLSWWYLFPFGTSPDDDDDDDPIRTMSVSTAKENEPKLDEAVLPFCKYSIIYHLRLQCCCRHVTYVYPRLKSWANRTRAIQHLIQKYIHRVRTYLLTRMWAKIPQKREETIPYSARFLRAVQWTRPGWAIIIITESSSTFVMPLPLCLLYRELCGTCLSQSITEDICYHHLPTNHYQCLGLRFKTPRKECSSFTRGKLSNDYVRRVLRFNIYFVDFHLDCQWMPWPLVFQSMELELCVCAVRISNSFTQTTRCYELKWNKCKEWRAWCNINEWNDRRNQSKYMVTAATQVRWC